MNDVSKLFVCLRSILASARRRRLALSFWRQKETKNAG